MKSMLIAMLFFTLSLAAKAQVFFPLNPFIQVRPEVISAQIYNPYYEPILCDGYALGRTTFGQVLQARFTDIIPAGQNRFAYVTTNGFTQPFLEGWAHIFCRFLR